MKIRISAFLFLLSMICVSVLNAQSSDWLWAKTFGGPNSNRINDYADASDGARVIECDTEGNIYMAGVMIDTAYADQIKIPSFGDFDIMVVKLNPTGKVLWATSIGSQNFDCVTGLSLDGQGNAYICGIFYGTMNLSGMSISANYGREMFVAKISPDGVWQWIRQSKNDISSKEEGYTNAIIPFDIVTNSQGISVMRCQYLGQVNLGSVSFPNTQDPAFCMAGIDSDGTWKWAIDFHDLIPNQAVSSLAINLVKDDHLILVGSSSIPELDESPAIVDSVSNEPTDEDQAVAPNRPDKSPNSQIFIAKYDLAGSKLWLVNYTNIYGDDPGSIGSVITDYDDNIYFSGYLEANAQFGNILVDGEYSNFLARADSLGNVVWAKAISKYCYSPIEDDLDSPEQLDLGIAQDKFLFLAMRYNNYQSNGFIKSQADQDHTHILLCVDTSGNYLDGEFLGSRKNDSWLNINCLKVDLHGDLIISGQYHDYINFGDQSLRTSGIGDGFVAKRILKND